LIPNRLLLRCIYPESSDFYPARLELLAEESKRFCANFALIAKFSVYQRVSKDMNLAGEVMDINLTGDVVKMNLVGKLEDDGSKLLTLALKFFRSFATM